MSIDYIVRLEQARGLRPSADVVEALAGALRLSPGERAYLYGLAQQQPRSAGKPAAVAAEPLAELIADLSPLPAMLLNHRYDILAWNREMARLLVDFAALPPVQRNAMWLCLRHPELQTFYTDRETVVRQGIAHLRAAWASHPDDAELGSLIAEFLDQDEEFARWWAERDVAVNGRGSKVLRHPEAGELTVRFEVLAPVEDPDQRVLIYRAADEGSRAALNRLFAA